jgi:hypothetical protein
MSGRGQLGGDRGEPDEVYLPGERFQPHPPIDWRAEIATIVLIAIIFAALHLTGLKAVLDRYVPTWAFGLAFIAFGLFVILFRILRPRARAASRIGDILMGALFVLLGAYLAFFPA